MAGRARGLAQPSVHFQVTHSAVYCPASQLNDVMFHLRLLVMLKLVVGTRGGKRQGESCKSGSLLAFVLGALQDKSWLMQYFQGRSCTDLVSQGSFHLTEPLREVTASVEGSVALPGRKSSLCSRFARGADVPGSATLLFLWLPWAAGPSPSRWERNWAAGFLCSKVRLAWLRCCFGWFCTLQCLRKSCQTGLDLPPSTWTAWWKGGFWLCFVFFSFFPLWIWVESQSEMELQLELLRSLWRAGHRKSWILPWALEKLSLVMCISRKAPADCAGGRNLAVAAFMLSNCSNEIQSGVQQEPREIKCDFHAGWKFSWWEDFLLGGVIMKVEAWRVFDSVAYWKGILFCLVTWTNLMFMKGLLFGIFVQWKHKNPCYNLKGWASQNGLRLWFSFLSGDKSSTVIKERWCL